MDPSGTITPSARPSIRRRIIIYKAIDILKNEKIMPSIPSFSQSLDGVLGRKGLQLGTTVEVIGLPGTGKTQLCLQLCAAVQIPRCLGSVEGEALYIDTNTNFTAHRFREILSATISRCRQLFRDMKLPLHMEEEEGLSRLHYVNAFGLVKFCAFVHRLPMFLDRHPGIKLIAIDSIIFPFKEDISPKKRTGLLYRIMSQLQQIATEKSIAVIFTNEMSTRVGLNSAPLSVGALGDAWAHRSSARVLLCAGVEPPARHALALTSNHAYMQVAQFQITREGIRDVEGPT